MRLVTYQTDGPPRPGALTTDGQVVDLGAAFASLQQVIEAGDEGLAMARDLLTAADNLIENGQYTLRAPLPRPAQIRDFLCFETHLKNSFASALKVRAMRAEDPAQAEEQLRASGQFEIPGVWYQQPIYYKGNRFAVAGPEEDIVWPAYSQVMDFELEFAAIIGKAGADIPKDAAAAHIFGYTIFNDFSARDAQMVEQGGMLGPAKGKDFDKANVLGPCIVTADEIGNPYDLRMQARVNGETWCDSSSATMHWRFEDLIAHVSRGETLHPGEVLGSGTVGMGCGLEHMKFLNHGDVVELEVEKIGILRNRVVRKGCV